MDKGTVYAAKEGPGGGQVVDPGKFSMKEDLKIFFNLGSTAGAGSGDFHTYRKLRAREVQRQQDMEDEWEKMEEKVGFEMRKSEAEEELAAKSQKRAAKRKRRKAQKKAGMKLEKLQKKNKFSDDGSFMEQMMAQVAAAGSVEGGADGKADGGAEKKADGAKAKAVEAAAAGLAASVVAEAEIAAALD